MRPYLCVAGAAMLALTAAPAFADVPPPVGDAPHGDMPGGDRPDGDRPGGDRPHGDDWRGPADGYPGDAHARFDPAARDAWLADCHERIAPRDAGPGPGECEAWLDQYYWAYTRGMLPGGGYSYIAPGYAPGSYGQAGYAGPMMMVPVTMVPQAKPDCKETVEYVTEYVPAPARRVIPRRPAKVVPDKRVKLKSIK